MNLSNNIDFAKKAEGTKRLHNGNHAPYQCPAGYTTIGYGRNIQTNGISENEAERMLMNDLAGSVALLEKHVPSWENHNEARQAVLIDMCFNMGWPTLSRFKNMLAALDKGDYEKASVEMMDSRWYRQVKVRGRKLVATMKTGVWQEYK